MSPKAAGVRAPGRPLALLAAALALAWSLIAAARQAWVCDDAFISFRYARNLVRGLGLVYNAGERVEGYTNFLWTLFTALGLRLGVDPRAWTCAFGVACYAACVALLAARQLRRQGRGDLAVFPLPLAALLAAVHLDWSIFATSGLETSLFTLLALSGCLLLAQDALSPRRAALAGLVLALAALTRPEGALFAGISGLWLGARNRKSPGVPLAFALAFLLPTLTFLAWRVHYYGDWLPNTYYAKSAGLAWYSQGWLYSRLYFFRYWPLLMGFVAPIVALLPGRPRPVGLPGETSLFFTLAAAYVFYVLRVGGDFMFARMLIPATPFLLMLLEDGLGRVWLRSNAAACVLGAAALLGTAFTPYPFQGTGWVGGIVNEKLYYTPERVAEIELRGKVLRRYFEGLDVRVAILGTDAALAWYSDVPVAIESQTGLTDRFIAHQALKARGRVGHEKAAPLDYLVGVRKVDFVFNPLAWRELDLPSQVPAVGILFEDVRGTMLRWDGPLLEKLRARGARFPDFPARMDAYLDGADALPDSVVRADAPLLKRFYFDSTPDLPRWARLEARLRKIPASR